MRHLDRPTGTRSGLLDRPMPLWLCGLILLAISIVPVWYVGGHYNPHHGFTDLILFGKASEADELPEVRAVHPAMNSDCGYDGQAYAQLALDPTFRRPDLKKAVPDVAYRSQRYLPILLSYVCGLGQPRWILNAYVLLNLVFWFVMLGLLAAYMRGRTVRQYLCVSAAALTTGALICIERSLGDLPGAAIVLGSALIDGAAAACLISLAALCKPSFVIAATRYVWPLPTTRRDWLERAGLFLLALSAPFVLGLYLRSLFGKLPAGTRNVSWPPGEWISQEQTNWHAFMAEPFHLSWWEVTVWEWRVFELIVPVCLLVQAVHLVLWRDYRSPLWWLGISFAALFLCLGQAVTAEEIASARTMLPLTLVFNMRLAGQRGGVFWGFFLAGNFGMFWCFQDMLAWCARQT